jgi:hypothetical protein
VAAKLPQERGAGYTYRLKRTELVTKEAMRLENRRPERGARHISVRGIMGQAARDSAQTNKAREMPDAWRDSIINGWVPRASEFTALPARELEAILNTEYLHGK